ncbi:MAG: NUDIX hydrolase [Verrucomicrobia bacterium]|nr:NUDIX hydrolase [Verrucomicrobiota bacterium]
MEKSERQRDLENRAKHSFDEMYQGRLYSIRREKLEFEDHTHDWDFVIHPGAVAAVPVKENGDLILIQQWRRAIKKIIYELPAGVLEKDEPPIKAVDRELQEEIGYKPKTLIPLGGFFSTPGFCTEYIHLFIAKDLSPSSLPGDLHEAIDIVEISLDEALKLIDTGEIDDMKTIAGLLRYQRWLEKN